MNESEFLFFNGLDKLSDMTDLPALTRRLVSFASEFALEGNIWQQWLSYMIMTDENAFSLACERRKVTEEATLLKLAEPDLYKFMDLMKMDPVPGLSDYKAPYKDSVMTAQGKRIAELSEKLASAADISEFCSLVTGAYAVHGAGMYGLYRAFRLNSTPSGKAEILPVIETSDVSFDELVGYDEHKRVLKENTEAFLRGEQANNVLLYGDSGTGKSTSIHALMHDYCDLGLRLIEIGKNERRHLPWVLAEVKKRNYRFIIYLDDLSFEENESDFKELKNMLERALESKEDRVLIYATSNRRHLIRETWNDRSDMEHDGDIHRSDTMEEKLSLASRFGITIYYGKPEYREDLKITKELAKRNGLEIDDEELESKARKWELRHGSTSGRTAAQLIAWLKSGKEKERGQNGEQ